MYRSDEHHPWSAQGMPDRSAFGGLITAQVRGRCREGRRSESRKMDAIEKGFFCYRAVPAVSSLDRPGPLDNGGRTHSEGVGPRSGGPCR